jgi:DNA (cytosine-5)-methyltransferase 1
MLLRGDTDQNSRATPASIYRRARAQMSADRAAYPVIDIFAGPGGLGEGFAAHLDQGGSSRFKSAVSIERDDFSHQTLLLRHFFRHFPTGEAPDDYYNFLKGEITREELYARHREAFSEAASSALRISLGPDSHSVVKKVIGAKVGEADKWALVGGPPCQAYSLVGRSRMSGIKGFEQDERHTLYLEYLRIIADHAPPVFVMENVKGLLSATIDGNSAVSRIVSDLSNPSSAIRTAPSDLGYRLFSLTQDEEAGGEVDPRLFVVRAEDHGIPQARHRMFIVGVRSDLNIRPGRLRRLDAPTVKETIGSLPLIRSGLSKAEDSPEAWRAELHKISRLPLRRHLNGAPYAADVASSLKWENLIAVRSPRQTSSKRYSLRNPNHPVLRSLYDSRLSEISSHEARAHMASDLRRYLFASTFAQKAGRSPKLSDFPEALLPDHQNVELGRSGKMFSDRFRVQLADHVATTVTSHISKDGHYFIHYDPVQCRSLTVREAARLQTFPDNYFFSGPRTQQFHQVGNAVPPQLASQIAEIIADVLDRIPDRA